jgi:hypothetical protein
MALPEAEILLFDDGQMRPVVIVPSVTGTPLTVCATPPSVTEAE